MFVNNMKYLIQKDKTNDNEWTQKVPYRPFFPKGFLLLNP